MSAKLRLLQFCELGGAGKQRVGVQLEGGRVVDVTAVDSSIPTDMRTFLQDFDVNTAAASRAIQNALDRNILQPDAYDLKAPIYDPQKLICIGLNYRDHCAEQNIKVPEEPLIFSKFSSSITEPNGAVELSDLVKELDFEVELAFVMSKAGRNIKAADAMSYVAGYTVAHDVSARDWQMKKNGGQWLIGKTFDTYCPLGPAIVTTAAISDPHNLGIRCRLNGETVQDSNTNQLVHKTQDLVAWISQFVTFQPGDVILTGTPPGVGVFRKPPLFMKKGDVVECEIDEIGTIRNVIQ